MRCALRIEAAASSSSSLIEHNPLLIREPGRVGPERDGNLKSNDGWLYNTRSTALQRYVASHQFYRHVDGLCRQTLMMCALSLLRAAGARVETPNDFITASRLYNAYKQRTHDATSSFFLVWQLSRL